MSGKTTQLSIVSAIFALLSVAAFLWVTSILLDGWAQRLLSTEREQKLVEVPYAELQDCRSQQQDRLSEYRWIDRDRGLVQVPIDRAMQLVSEESK